jgi:hypothetical protein
MAGRKTGHAVSVRTEKGVKAALPVKASYPPGYWMELGIAMGIPLGIPVGLLAGFSMGDIGTGIATGPAFGVAIGTGVGWTLERRHASEIRAFTKGERSVTKKLGIIGLSSLALAAGMLLFFSFF